MPDLEEIVARQDLPSSASQRGRRFEPDTDVVWTMEEWDMGVGNCTKDHPWDCKSYIPTPEPVPQEKNG